MESENTKIRYNETNRYWLL